MAPMATGTKSITRVGLLRKPDSLSGDWIPKEDPKPIVRLASDAAGLPSSKQVTSIGCRSPHRRMDSLTNALCPLPSSSAVEAHGSSRKRTASNHKDSIGLLGMAPISSSDQDPKLFHKKQFARSISHDAPREQVTRGRGCANGTKNGDQIASSGVTKCLWYNNEKGASPADLTDAVTLLARRRPGPASALKTHIGRNGTPEPSPRPMIRCISPDLRLVAPSTPSSIKTAFQRQNSSTSFIDHMNKIHEPRSTLRCIPQSPARANPNVLADTASSEPVRRRAAVSPSHHSNRNPILLNEGKPKEPSTCTTPTTAQGRKTFHNVAVHRQVPHVSPSRMIHRVPNTGAPFAYDSEEPTKKTLQVGRKSAPLHSTSPSRDVEFRTGKRLVRRAVSPLPVEPPKNPARLKPRTGIKPANIISFGGNIAAAVAPTEAAATEVNPAPRKERIVSKSAGTKATTSTTTTTTTTSTTVAPIVAAPTNSNSSS